MLHVLDGEPGGEPGGAEGHRVEGRHALGTAHHPVGGHAHALGVAAVVRRRPCRSRCTSTLSPALKRGSDDASTVPAMSMPATRRVLAHDLAGAVVRQGILVVDRRVLGADDHLAMVELVDRHVDEGARHHAVLVERAVGLELVGHGSLLLVSLWSGRNGRRDRHAVGGVRQRHDSRACASRRAGSRCAGIPARCGRRRRAPRRARRRRRRASRVVVQDVDEPGEAAREVALVRDPSPGCRTGTARRNAARARGSRAATAGRRTARGSRTRSRCPPAAGPPAGARRRRGAATRRRRCASPRTSCAIAASAAGPAGTRKQRACSSVRSR